MESITIDKKGRIVIPDVMRKKLEIMAGDKLALFNEGKMLFITKY